jgi:hypothetical protein
MRTFRFYMYILEKGTRPDQVVDLLARYLNDKNLKYRDLYYYFSNYIDNSNQEGELHSNRETESIAKLCAKYPELNPFRRNEKSSGQTSDISVLSNYTESWNRASANVPDELILQIVSKIPRPYNFCDSKLYFDGVTFFNDESAPLGSYTDDLASASKIPLGSYIAYYRDGIFTRWHMISLCFDVTAKSDLFSFVDRQYIEYLNRVFPIKLLADDTFFGLNQDERAQYEAINASLSEIVSKARSMCQFPLGKLAECANADRVLIGGNYSLKKSLTKLIPLHGYAYQRYHYYTYFFGKKDQFGHQIQFNINSAPFSRDIQTTFTYKGLGFHYDFALPMFTPQNQQEADQYVEAIMEFMDEFEVSYLSVIGAAYPATPAL